MAWLLALAVVVLIGGCASLERVADRTWSAGESAVTAMLRPFQSRDRAVFEHSDTTVVWESGDAGVNTALLERRVWEAELARGRSVEAALPTVAADPGSPSPDPLAYVNLSGPTDIADWAACEARAGSAFTPDGIAPRFDACLRSLGYLPEPEALAILSR